MSAILLIGTIYWPVRQAEFIWDDTTAFHNAAWLRHGDAWLKFLLTGMSGWINYFRPLVVALFTLQLRLFDAQPGPMHLVSLGIHLCNTILVGLLASRFCMSRNPSPLVIAGCMLFYGIHPALVEPVVWISCQYELAVSFFILLALLANVSIVSNHKRALAIGLCFFLGACAKESAIALPLLIVLFDLFRRGWIDRMSWPEAARTVLRDQRSVYVGMLAAGIAYVVFRAWALGFVVVPSGSLGLFTVARWQKVCFTFVNYIRLAVWPMDGLGPLHEVSDNYFAAFSWRLLMQDIAAIAVLLVGAMLFLRRRPLGVLIVSFAAALFAVLNIIPVQFAESVYHERYLMVALAVGAAWAAPVFAEVVALPYRWMAGLLAVAWLGCAVANVRVTIPLWSDENSLWQWAARLNPDSLIVRDHLLSVYVSRDDYARARSLAQEMIDQQVDCPNCMINAAFLALNQGDETMAAAALDRLGNNRVLAYDHALLHHFILASGELLELRKDLKGAEDAYRDAIATDPYDPTAAMQLAALLLFEGRFDEGEKIGRLAIELSAPDERERRQAVLDAVTKAGKSSPLPPNSR